MTANRFLISALGLNIVDQRSTPQRSSLPYMKLFSLSSLPFERTSILVYARTMKIKNTTLCEHHEVSNLGVEYPFWELTNRSQFNKSFLFFICNL